MPVNGLSESLDSPDGWLALAGRFLKKAGTTAVKDHLEQVEEEIKTADAFEDPSLEPGEKIDAALVEKRDRILSLLAPIFPHRYAEQMCNSVWKIILLLFLGNGIFEDVANVRERPVPYSVVVGAFGAFHACVYGSRRRLEKIAEKEAKELPKPFYQAAAMSDANRRSRALWSVPWGTKALGAIEKGWEAIPEFSDEKVRVEVKIKEKKSNRAQERNDRQAASEARSAAAELEDY